MVTRSELDLQDIRAEFKKLYKSSLYSTIKVRRRLSRLVMEDSSELLLHQLFSLSLKTFSSEHNHDLFNSITQIMQPNICQGRIIIHIPLLKNKKV